MGSAHSASPNSDDDEDDDDDDDGSGDRRLPTNTSLSVVLEQEPEILPCHASASPLSPQSSAAGTPRLLGPAIKVWDPCHVLLPPAEAPPDRAVVEVYLITHGECGASLRPDLVGGRWPASDLTGNGERQSRALAVLLHSLGVRFSAVFTSPLDRARATAALVCRELDFAEQNIQSADALVEMSQGHWEGCHRSEIYAPGMINLIDKTQPDFSAPSGESLRQVEFRMIEFLNRTVLGMTEKLITGEALMHQSEIKGFSCHSSTNSAQGRDGPHWDLVYRLNSAGFVRKKSGKSRLQFVTTGDNETEDDYSPREANPGHLHQANAGKPSICIGIFTHAISIKCLLAGLLECSPAMSNRLCIDDSSMTILQHSLRTGWQIKRLNDTAHLRLL